MRLLSLPSGSATPGTAVATDAYLERLVVNVSHDCNMRCTYCFADTGAYRAERGMLSDATATRIIDDFFSRFGQIGRIQFFGGEPLLNAAGIATLCRRTAEVCAERNRPLPAFTMITNGTIVNDAVIDLVRTYGIHVTVSLDGLEAMNDTYRTFAGGGGSFRRVVNNIHALKAATGEPFQIEGTFTRLHLERRVSVAEFLRFMAEELDVHFLHMPWILGGQAYHGTGIVPTEANLEALVETYGEAITASLRSLTGPEMRDSAILSIVERFMNRATSRGEATPQRYYCPAGNGTLSVGMDGTVSPCFMFTNIKAFELSHVDATDRDELGRNRATFLKQIERPKGEGAPREVLSSCAGMNYEAHGRITGISAGEKYVWDRLNAQLAREADTWALAPETWGWMQAKFLLHRLETLGVFDQPAACS